MDYSEIFKVSATVRARYNTAQQKVIDMAVELIRERMLAAERQLAAQSLTAAEKDEKLATTYFDAIVAARILIPGNVLESLIHAPEHRHWEYVDAKFGISELERLQAQLIAEHSEAARKLKIQKRLGIAKGVGIGVLKAIVAAGEDFAEEDDQVIWETAGNVLDTLEEQSDDYPDADTGQTEKHEVICIYQSLFETPALPRTAKQLDEMDANDMTDDEFQEWRYNTLGF